MSTKIDQKSYLQKYLGGPSVEKKKKKKKAIKGKGFKIIDDDVDLTKLRPFDGDELDVFDEGEDAPQIAGIIDERPEDIKKLEQFKTTSKWKVVNKDDGFNSKLQIEEIKKDVKEREKENELIFGKMYSDTEDEEKNDSDMSPPRKTNGNNNSKINSKKHNSDSDFSPPRRREKESPKRSENKTIYDSDPSPLRKQSYDKAKTSKKRASDSDASPPRKRDAKESIPPKNRNDPSPKRHESRKPNEKRKPSRWGNWEDDVPRQRSPESESPRRSKKQKTTESPIGLSKKDSGKRSVSSDLSPPRKSKKVRNNSKSPPRNRDDLKKRNRSVDSDMSPPRKRRSSPQNNKHGKTARQKNEKHTYNSDSELSPPRNNKRQRSTSPARKYKKHSPEKSSKRKHDYDSDLSPPRKERDRNKSERDEKSYKRRSDSPPPSNKKMARTLDGKLAGLQDARQLRHENDEFRRKEDEVFKSMGDEVSGRNAQVVSRKSKRETSEDRQKHREKAERQKELDEKYKKWGKGIKQMQDQQDRVEEFMHEASKPLARHKDDRDLEATLKQVDRDGDPMLKYIQEKKRERGELGPEKPTYKGNFPPNRFNIRPGYRWDGVDRSNGYEKKYFDQQSKRKAQEEEAYKWSTEDL